MDAHNIVVLFACYNRYEKTRRCIESLTAVESINCKFIIADGGSTDGTIPYLEGRKDVHLIRSNGELFYSNGMRSTMEYLKSHDEDYEVDTVLLVNDDAYFYEDSIHQLILDTIEYNAVMVGCTEDGQGNLSYGGIIKLSNIRPKTKHVMSKSEKVKCDTCNGNCVALPWEIFKSVDSMDSHYIHSLGDYDYGFSITKKGHSLLASNYFVGVCVDDHSKKNSWMDTTLTRKERLAKKEKVLGHPTKAWFYYLKKNYNILTAVTYVALDYLKILLKKS